ncbi:MAG: hypothetical protein Q8Q09_18500 [Deltaproteobacteria bacterium]|nr:hypothetical protein [Deltaproteobacteria bacterium]
MNRLSLALVTLTLAGCSDRLVRWNFDSGTLRPDADAGTGPADDANAAADGAAMDVIAPRDVPPVDRDVVPLEPDAACLSAESVGVVERQPVDIIWVVDNSTSMEPSIREVTNGLNDFARRVGTRGLDYRVVMLSLRSATNPVRLPAGNRYGVCIPQPLAGNASCGNGPRFFHSSIDIRSTQPLEQLLGSLAQTAGYQTGQERGGEPWRDFLRPGATKSIVVVTDDESRMPSNEFEHFAGGTNPRSGSFTLPPGLLEPMWAGLFTGYTFNALYGWDSETNPATRCMYPGGTMPPSSGPTYTTLVSRTMGARAKICEGASAWSPFFDRIATAVERTSRLACDLAIPAVPDGMVLDPSRINVAIRNTASTNYPRKVADASACGATGGWYYDNERTPRRIFLCPTSCSQAQAAIQAGMMTSIRVLFGCQTIPG